MKSMTHTAAAFMATLNATGAHRLLFHPDPCARGVHAAPLATDGYCDLCRPSRPEPRTFDAYRLPDGTVVRCDASACKGEAVIDFTLADGRIVKATKVSR